jgi:CRP/FNR family cyclic AMP-dependent transcriptional regulator
VTEAWSLLDDLDGAARQAVRAAAMRRKFARREVVCHEGDPGDSLHVIDSGRVAARVTTLRGDVATLSVMGPGDTFGELALLDPASRRTATIVALEPTVTLSFGASAVAELRAQHSEFDRAISRVLAEMVRHLSALVLEALYVPADARVARRISDLADMYGDASGSIEITLTQDDIATMAGTSRATVNRVLGELAAAGALEVTRGRIKVTDRGPITKAAR